MIHWHTLPQVSHWDPSFDMFWIMMNEAALPEITFRMWFLLLCVFLIAEVFAQKTQCHRFQHARLFLWPCMQRPPVVFRGALQLFWQHHEACCKDDDKLHQVITLNSYGHLVSFALISNMDVICMVLHKGVIQGKHISHHISIIWQPRPRKRHVRIRNIRLRGLTGTIFSSSMSMLVQEVG